MPYSAEAKTKAKRFLRQVRSVSSCVKCGRQPVDFHNEEHEQHPNRRVAHLAALGFPLKRIKEEIEKSEVLCRSCHMKQDGRLEALHRNKPRQKGVVIVGPKPCRRCTKLYKPLRRGLCNACYKRNRES